MLGCFIEPDAMLGCFIEPDAMLMCCISCVCDIGFRGVGSLMMTTHYWMDFKQNVTIHEKCYGDNYDMLKWKGNRDTSIENTQQCRGVTELFGGSIVTTAWTANQLIPMGILVALIILIILASIIIIIQISPPDVSTSSRSQPEYFTARWFVPVCNDIASYF